MRERWFRQSQRALFTWGKGSDFSSHINARLSSMTRLEGWPFNPGQVFSYKRDFKVLLGSAWESGQEGGGRMTTGTDTMFLKGTYWLMPSSNVVYTFHMCQIWHKWVWTIYIFLISIKFSDVWTWFEVFFKDSSRKEWKNEWKGISDTMAIHFLFVIFASTTLKLAKLAQFFQVSIHGHLCHP